MTRSPRGASLARWWLRLAVAAGLLALAIGAALPDDRGDLLATLRSAYVAGDGATALCFAAAFAIFGAGFGIGARRFQLLLEAAALHVRFPTLLRAYVIAGFVNLVLPGAVLGDVYRFVDARRDAGRGSEVLGLVLLERLLGLSALGATALAGALFAPLPGAHASTRGGLVAACLALAALPLLPLLPRFDAALRAAARRLAPVSASLAGRTTRALDAVAGVSQRPPVVLRTLGLSLVVQGLPIAAVWLLALPLAHAVPWTWFVVIVPFVTLVSMLPVTIGGAGVRELLFITLFGALGMRSEVALLLSLEVLATALAWAAIGGVLFARGRSRKRMDGDRVESLDSAL